MSSARYLRSPIPRLRRIAAITVALLGLAGGANDGDARSILWGVNGHPFTAYPGISPVAQLDLVRELGARSYRVNVSSIDHIERLRDLIALGARRGIEILPVLTPPFDLAKSSTESLYANSFNFAFTIASAIRRHVHTIELGNELENFAIIKPCEQQTDGRIYSCSHGLGTGIATTDYEGARWKKVSAVLKGLSDGTVAADPAIKKAMGSAGWGHTGVFALMQADGIRWDISVWHSYQQDPPALLKAVAAFNKPIWITEFNASATVGGDPNEHAKRLQTMIDGLKGKLARFNIQAVHFYELLDEPYWGADAEAIMGLVELRRNNAGNGWDIAERKPSFDVAKAAIGDTIRVIQRDCDPDSYRSSNREATTQARIEFAYCLVLGRMPEADVAGSWVQAVKAGRSLVELIVTLCETDEFLSRYGASAASHREFLGLAYDLLLGRRPDGGGLQSYLDALGRGTLQRKDVIRGIVTSSEFSDRNSMMLATAAEGRADGR